MKPFFLTVTGDQRTDHALSGIVNLCEMMFPQRISGYYLVGSLGCGYAVIGSDIDIFLVFKNKLLPGESQTLERLMGPLWLLGVFDIDLKCLDEDSVHRLMLLGPGLCIYGEDIRPDIDLDKRPIDLIRFAFYQSLGYFFRLRDNPKQLSLPLCYPVPDQRFKGYSSRPTHDQSGAIVPGVRELLNNTLKPASTLVDLATGRFNKDKLHIARNYGEYVDATWIDYLEEVERLVRRQWAGRVPDEEGDKQKLEQLCARALDFENAVLEHYRDIILSELQGAGGPSLSLSRDDIERFFPLLAPVVIEHLQSEAKSEAAFFQTAGIYHLFALNALTRLRFRDQAITQAVTRLKTESETPAGAAAAALLKGNAW